MTPAELEARLQRAEDLLKETQRTKAAGIVGGGVYGNRSGSDENLTLAHFGCKGVPDLLRRNLAAPEFGHVDLRLKSAALALKRDFDICRLFSQIAFGEGIERGAATGDHFEGLPVKGIMSTGVWKRLDMDSRLKAFGTSTVGQGAEWIMTAIAANYIEEYELARKIESLFTELKMPTDPYKQPFAKNVRRARRVAEGAQATASEFGTDVITFESEKFFEYYNLPEELNEDSAPNILQLARAELVNSIQRGKEFAMLNGDDSVTHMDSDIVSAADSAKNYKGLRKLALDNTANGTVVNFNNLGPTLPKLDQMREAMGKFGSNIAELGWIFSPRVDIKVSNLPEVTSVEKMGPNATIIKGALASLRGIGIFASEHMREDLNASGVFDGVTTNRSAALLVNMKRFYSAMRRPIRISAKPDADVSYDRWQLVAYERSDFQAHPQTATEKSVVIGVNIAL
jgi:hypothetical protein